MKTFKELFVESFIEEGEMMTDADIAVAIRSMISAEYDAIKLYTQFAETIDNDLVKQVLLSVIEEERIHAGEFQKLLFTLDPKEKELYDQGATEVGEQ